MRVNKTQLDPTMKDKLDNSGVSSVLWLCCSILHGALSISPVGRELPINTVNICDDTARFRCDDGQLISVVDVNCGNDRGACPDVTQTTISRMCDQQQTCHTQLRAVLEPDVCSSPLRVGFQCKKGTTSVCQTNICADASKGLLCPSGNVIHIRHMTCLAPTSAGECDKSSYATLFMCEGAKHCDSSGLRALLPELCPKSGDTARRAVFVQYFCVPESQVDTSCSTGRFHRLKGPFGVIRPPRVDSVNSDVSFTEEEDREEEGTQSEDPPTVPPKSNSSKDGNSKKRKNKKGSPTRCKWLINPRDDIIEVKVHQLTSASPGSSVASAGATTSFSSSSPCPELGLLSIKYRDCKAGNQTRTLTVCDKDGMVTSEGQPHLSPPLHLQSCGMIQLTSALPIGNGPQVALDKLIISYHKMAASLDQDVPSGISQCLAQHTLHSLLPGGTTEITSDRGMSESAYVPAGPSSISKTFGHSEDGNKDNAGSSSRFPKLKLFILYIVFGVIIVALLIALIVVIVSYRRISVRKTRARGDSGERTALWLYPRQDDTPLETFFQTNSLADGSAASMTSGSESSHRKVIASVHLEPEATRTSRGSSLSTFAHGHGEAASDRGRDSTGLKDLIDTFQSGTFPGYSSLRDLCGPARFSTGSLEGRADGVEYELTDSAPAVVGGVRHSYNEACDGGALYVTAGTGQYASVGPPDNAVKNSQQGRQDGNQKNESYTGFNGGGHYALPLVDGPYASIDDDGGLYSTPQDGGLYASPDIGDLVRPISGHYGGGGGNSSHYESTGSAGDGHYESLPCADSNIYEAIGSTAGDHKRHRKSKGKNSAATTTGIHEQHPPVPPPLPAPVANGGLNHERPLDEFHYRVNNDEYALVRKPNRQTTAISSSKSLSASLGRPVDQLQSLTNGEAGTSNGDMDFHGMENPYSQISDQHWKRRSAPTPQNGGWARSDPWEDVV